MCVLHIKHTSVLKVPTETQIPFFSEGSVGVRSLWVVGGAEWRGRQEGCPGWNRKRRQLRGWQLEKLGLPRPKGTVTAVSVYGVSPSALTEGALRMQDVEGVELG